MVTNEPDSEANASNETFLSSTPRPLSDSLTTTTATAGDAGDDPYSDTEPRWKRTRFIEQLETQSDSLGHPLSRALGYNSLAFRSLRETSKFSWLADPTKICGGCSQRCIASFDERFARMVVI